VVDVTFQVSIPTDEGFLGRECHNPDCRRYFRVHAESTRDELRCPYCWHRSGIAEFYAKDHIDHLRDVAAEHAKEHISNEVAKMFEHATRDSRSLSFKRGTPYRAKQVTPRHVSPTEERR